MAPPAVSDISQAWPRMVSSTVFRSSEELTAWLTCPSAFSSATERDSSRRARLHLLEQPRVLDGDHGLVGERLEQIDLPVGERSHGSCGQRRCTPTALPSRSSGTPRIDADAPVACCVDAARCVLGIEPARRQYGSTCRSRMARPVMLPTRPARMGCFAGTPRTRGCGR